MARSGSLWLVRGCEDRNIYRRAGLSPGSVVSELVMSGSSWSPSILPDDDDQTVYLVMDDLGERGRIWPEADADTPDLEAVIQDLLDGQYSNPVRVIGFNVREGWARDVSADVAIEIRQRCDLQFRDVPFLLQDCVDRHQGRYHDMQHPCHPACVKSFPISFAVPEERLRNCSVVPISQTAKEPIMDREHVKGAADKQRAPSRKVPVNSLVTRKWKTKASSTRPRGPLTTPQVT